MLPRIEVIETDRKTRSKKTKERQNSREKIANALSFLTADWLLARILKWIADRLILYPNHRSIERTKLLECFQEYDGCLSEATRHAVETRAKAGYNLSILCLS